MSRLDEIRKRLRQQALGAGNFEVCSNATESKSIQQSSLGRGIACQSLAHTVRKALILGNSAYEQGELNGCRSDAEAMGKFFRDVGYIVTGKFDATAEEMNKAFQDFENNVDVGDEAVIYFSGHGFQLNSEQYLAPIDNTPRNEHPLDSLYRSINLQERIDRIMMSGARMTLAIVDACRHQYRLDLANNSLIDPYGQQIPIFQLSDDTLSSNKNLKKSYLNAETIKSGQQNDGLSRKGIGIVYASSHNTASYDSSYLSHGIFTAVFLQEAIVPGRSISEVVHIVRDKVIQQSRMETALHTSGNEEQTQAPAFYDSLDGDFYFIPPDSI